MPKEIKAYKCLFCGRTIAQRARAIRHENDCLFNPESKSCPTCEYDYKGYSGYYYGSANCEPPEPPCCWEDARGESSCKKHCESWKLLKTLEWKYAGKEGK